MSGEDLIRHRAPGGGGRVRGYVLPVSCGQVRGSARHLRALKIDIFARTWEIVVTICCSDCGTIEGVVLIARENRYLP